MRQDFFVIAGGAVLLMLLTIATLYFIDAILCWRRAVVLKRPHGILKAKHLLSL